MHTHYKIAMIGLGSIGKRHLTNIVDILAKRGITFSLDLVRSGEGKALAPEIAQHVNHVYTSAHEAPDDYDVVFITNPTHLHLQTLAQFVGKAKHLFIEKPVFDRTDLSIASLGLKKDGIYYVACPLRYTDVIQYLKQHIDASRVYSARVICSSYLPDWRPEQDYRQTYSAHQTQGGGVSIDLIHEWDYLCYLFGQPQQVMNLKGQYSNLEVDSDDLSLYIAHYPTMAVEVHLDYFGRHTMREIQLFTPEDTIVGDLTNSEIRFLKSGKTISFREQRNDFQRKEIAHFFDILEGKAVNENDVATALTTLKIARGEC